MKRNRKFLSWTAPLAMASFLLAPALLLAKSKPPQNVISMKKARVIALKNVSGKIKEAELEFENKIWIYSFDLAGKDKKIHEVNVDAVTGKVVSSTIESPAAEAKEAKQDQAAAPAPKEQRK